MQEEITRDETPREVIDLIEELARGLGCASGHRTIELVFHHGHYDRAFFKHGPVLRNEIGEMWQPAAERD